MDIVGGTAGTRAKMDFLKMNIELEAHNVHTCILYSTTSQEMALVNVTKEVTTLNSKDN
jgi:hypothetical protein